MQVTQCLFLSLLTVLPAMAAPGCTDTPVNVTFEFSYTDPHTGAAYLSAMYSDGTTLNNPPYIHGVDRVTAVINCTSKDLVLDVGSSPRAIGFRLTDVLWTNNTPAWVSNATQNPFYSKASLTVRNILYAYNPSGDYEFTTRLGSSMPGPDKKTYFPRMVNPLSDAVTTSPDPAANYPSAPFQTSLVRVRHTANPESWTIYPDGASMGGVSGGADATQVLSLLELSKNSYVNRGQFRVPFYIVVKRQ